MAYIVFEKQKSFSITVRFIKKNTTTGEVQLKFNRELCTLTKEQVDNIYSIGSAGVDVSEDLLLRRFIKKGIEKTFKVNLELSDINTGVLAHIYSDLR